jgi:hypothetical protein
LMKRTNYDGSRYAFISIFLLFSYQPFLKYLTKNLPSLRVLNAWPFKAFTTSPSLDLVLITDWSAGRSTSLLSHPTQSISPVCLRPLKTPKKYTFTLKKTTVVFAETLVLQPSPRLVAENILHI